MVVTSYYLTVESVAKALSLILDWLSQLILCGEFVVTADSLILDWLSQLIL